MKFFGYDGEMGGVKRIGVSGGAGQIAYQLLFQIGRGELYGSDQEIALHILETPSGITRLRGVVMELEDCAFPLLREVVMGSNPKEVLRNTESIFLIGAKPRGVGMERKDLLLENGEIFLEQGRAIGEVAADGSIVLVVGNPCNTNSLIVQTYAQRSHCYSMSWLDQNRALALLAKKANVAVSQVRNVTIWGNHSATQVPDVSHATIGEQPVLEVIGDQKWLEEDFIKQVQERGTAVLQARGSSSAASAARAAIESMQALIYPTPQGQWFSMGVLSDDNPYSIAPGICCSFPCRLQEVGRVEIVSGLLWNRYLQEKIAFTQNELLEEKNAISHLLCDTKRRSK